MESNLGEKLIPAKKKEEAKESMASQITDKTEEEKDVVHELGGGGMDTGLGAIEEETTDLEFTEENLS